jgi:hypothetical protein
LLPLGLGLGLGWGEKTTTYVPNMRMKLNCAVGRQRRNFDIKSLVETSTTNYT